MVGGAQLMKRIPRIKFPNRHPQTSGSASQTEVASSNPAAGNADVTFFSNLKATSSVGGKASLQPKRTPLSKEEIEAILLLDIAGGLTYKIVLLDSSLPEHLIWGAENPTVSFFSQNLGGCF